MALKQGTGHHFITHKTQINVHIQKKTFITSEHMTLSCL